MKKLDLLLMSAFICGVAVTAIGLHSDIRRGFDGGPSDQTLVGAFVVIGAISIFAIGRLRQFQDRRFAEMSRLMDSPPPDGFDADTRAAELLRAAGYESAKAVSDATANTGLSNRRERRPLRPVGELVTVRNHVAKGGWLGGTERFSEIETTSAVLVVHDEIRFVVKGLPVYLIAGKRVHIGGLSRRSFRLRAA